MKQILQNISNGETSLVDIPRPLNNHNHILIESTHSVISSGTEKMLIDFGKGSYIDKARQQPEKVIAVIDKIMTDGLIATFDAVKTKLDQPIPLGYSNSGIVIESNNDGFNIGDRVISNGHHAEFVSVGRNLCAKIPDNVDNESASFTVIGSIALEGIRLIKPSLGESIVVFGLGLIGLMTVQMLKANGCKVIAIDMNSDRCSIAESFGAKTIDLSESASPIDIVNKITNGYGVDGAIIATATNSNEVIHQAAKMCRKRGQIVLVGTTGLNIKRDDFYEKELTFSVSCSYGPGRYDSTYEDQGIDYPYGYVRWTEQRNFEAVLGMMSDGSLDIKKLISHRFVIDDAIKAYKLLDDPSALGILLEYPKQESKENSKTHVTLQIEKDIKTYAPEKPVIGLVGAGNYASRVLIPSLQSSNAQLKNIVSQSGVTGVHHGSKAGFLSASTDFNEILSDDEINTVIIATRHNLHANQVNDSLKAGKNVFVEKPLALTIPEVKSIEKNYIKAKKASDIRLMVGFNRRFSPHILKMRHLIKPLSEIEKSAVMTINAGLLPSDHWLNDPLIGGGRIIGEACHFIDLMTFLFQSKVKSFNVLTNQRKEDVSINLLFEDDSTGVIHYLCNGAPSFPKERIEIFCNNSILQLDNFKTLKGYNWPGFKKFSTLRQDKGQDICIKSFLESIESGANSPISESEIFHSSIISIEVAKTIAE